MCQEVHRKLQHFETRASAHTVHIPLKNESTKFQEESWSIHHHHFGSRFHPLCHSAHVSFRVLLHHHWLLPHLGNQGEKENNLDHPPWVQTALVGRYDRAEDHPKHPRVQCAITETDRILLVPRRSQHAGSRFIFTGKFLACANTLQVMPVQRMPQAVICKLRSKSNSYKTISASFFFDSCVER